MRNTTPTKLAVMATDSQASLDAAPVDTLAMSALQVTREAIARWTGGIRPRAELARDIPRVSPQARWVAQAQHGLAMWIECGGFSQSEQAMCSSSLPLLSAPVMFEISALPDASNEHIDACMD